MIIKGNKAKCPACGSQFIRIRPSHTYCSEKCRIKGTEQKKELTGSCPVCGKSFVKKKQSQLYCGENCRFVRAAEKRINVKRFTSAHKCVICGKLLANKKQKICGSPECVIERRKQTRTDKPRPYQSKKKPFSVKLTPEIRARLKEIKEINKLRVSMDLRPIMAGIIQCCKCEQDFFSEDITRVKMCDLCKEAAGEFDCDNIVGGGAKQNKKWMS